MTQKSINKRPRLNSLLSKFNPSSPKTRFLIVIMLFAVLGGGYYAYKSFADTVRPAVYTFSSSSFNAQQIYTVFPDGSGARQVTNVLAGNSSPRLSPDRSKIVSETSAGGTFPLALSTYNGSSWSRSFLTTPPAGDKDSMPAWSPDGSKVVFFRGGTSNTGMYVINTDKTGLRRVISLIDGTNLSPYWAPDGSKIYYYTAYGTIYSVNLDGTNNKLVASAPAGTRLGGFNGLSPDGKNVLYLPVTTDANGQTTKMSLYIARSDGTNAHALYTGSTQATFPMNGQFSPDGLSVIFIGNNSRTIYRINLFTNQVTALINKPASDIGSFSSIRMTSDSKSVIVSEYVNNAGVASYSLSTYSTLGNKTATLRSGATAYLNLGY